MTSTQGVKEFMRVNRQEERAALLARRDKSHLQVPAHSTRDAKAGRNLLYLRSKGVLPAEDLSPRYTTVITNDNIRRAERKADLAHDRKARLLMLNPTIER